MQSILTQYFCKFFDFKSLKTVFYKISTANYIQFLTAIIIKKETLLRLLLHNFWNSSYLSWFILANNPTSKKQSQVFTLNDIKSCSEINSLKKYQKLLTSQIFFFLHAACTVILCSNWKNSNTIFTVSEIQTIDNGISQPHFQGFVSPQQ